MSNTEVLNEPQPLLVRDLSMIDYDASWQAMKTFTNIRGPEHQDEIWLLEHPSVFTQGQAGKAEHVLAPGDIPVVQADRGGQVTYHGPGQLVAYVLFDLKRQKIGVRELVHKTEEVLISLLKQWGIDAYADPDAPGVYIGDDKIASVGMRVRRGCSFHGLAINLDTDLEPFTRINPCGYAGMKATRLANHSSYSREDFTQVKQQLVTAYCDLFNLVVSGHASDLPVFEENK